MLNRLITASARHEGGSQGSPRPRSMPWSMPCGVLDNRQSKRFRILNASVQQISRGSALDGIDRTRSFKFSGTQLHRQAEIALPTATDDAKSQKTKPGGRLRIGV